MTGAFKRRLLMVAMGLLMSNAAYAQGPRGTWLMQNGKAEVTIAPCGDRVCGKVSRVIKYPKDGARTDIHNGDAKLRGRPLLGLPVLLDFKQAGNAWSGRVYDPKSGRTYAATLTQARQDRLTVKACLLFICKTQEWTRTQS